MIGLLSEIVEWKNLIETEADEAIVEFAIFKKDFFPWSKGDEVVVIQLKDHEEKGIWLEEMDGEKVVQSCRVRLVSEAATVAQTD